MGLMSGCIGGGRMPSLMQFAFGRWPAASLELVVLELCRRLQHSRSRNRRGDETGCSRLDRVTDSVFPAVKSRCDRYEDEEDKDVEVCTCVCVTSRCLSVYPPSLYPPLSSFPSPHALRVPVCLRLSVLPLDVSNQITACTGLACNVSHSAYQAPYTLRYL